MNSDYRKSFDRFLFAPTAPDGMSSRTILLYRAFHGDGPAFHSFLHHPDRDGAGHFGEEWINECVVLLLKLGDDQFSQLLAKEDHATREKVGEAIDTQIDFKKDHFPKTRALYHFRWGPREPQSPQSSADRSDASQQIMTTRLTQFRPALASAS